MHVGQVGRARAWFAGVEMEPGVKSAPWAREGNAWLCSEGLLVVVSSAPAGLLERRSGCRLVARPWEVSWHLPIAGQQPAGPQGRGQQHHALLSVHESAAERSCWAVPLPLFPPFRPRGCAAGQHAVRGGRRQQRGGLRRHVLPRPLAAAHRWGGQAGGSPLAVFGCGVKWWWGGNACCRLAGCMVGSSCGRLRVCCLPCLATVHQAILRPYAPLGALPCAYAWPRLWYS